MTARYDEQREAAMRKMPAADQETVRQEDARALANGKITSDGLRIGSADGHRTMIQTDPKSRRRCSCCGKRCTHVGLGDGVALLDGCEWRVRRWVKTGDLS